MKKSYIIISAVVGCLLLIFGIIMLLGQKDKEVYSTIYLEINPRIEIKLNKDKNVISVDALNDDAKEVIPEKYKGNNLDDLLKNLVENLIDKGYTKDNKLTMIINTSGELNSEDVRNNILYQFGEKDIEVDAIIIDSINKEDEELAKEYNISPYKAALINSIKQENEKIDIENLINRSIEDIEETKITGNTCDEGYFLDGDHCFKEIGRTEAKSGSVCPREYTDYNGKCYEETHPIEGTNLVCHSEYTLTDGICYRKDVHDALPECGEGTYHGDEDVCYEQVYIGDAYEYCRDPGRTLYDHKCLATKPTINGGCLNGDMLYNGKCVNTRNDYYVSEWICPDGKTNSNLNGELINLDNKCYREQKDSSPTYTCDEGFRVEGKLCIKEDTEKPEKEKICPRGFIKIGFDRCINMNNVKEYETGLVCDQDAARVEDNVCVIYDIVEAKHNG